ncbi:1-deoxy-D-xylulose-5-phosphate reductoisomerase [bacterium]|nr:1-deoxy-D-xylulose-5-phosphate reductoisomerase [bacterium]
MKRLCILGATGSIGQQSLDVVRQHPDQFTVVGLSGHRNISQLIQDCLEFRPECVHVPDSLAAQKLTAELPKNIRCLVGPEALISMAQECRTDLLILAIVGTASLAASYAAICARIPIALACKEVLVSAGSLIQKAARDYGVPLLPIDSEHAAIHQCLAYVQHDITHVRRMTLTASGGPFWNQANLDWATITPDEAVKHPQWSMGKKISVDSATLMNKGLELIEAHYLFDIAYEKLSVLIHPQSVVHSIVDFVDGVSLAQMGPADMRIPIQYALTYPESQQAQWPTLNLHEHTLTFTQPDTTRFPLLDLAITCGKHGGGLPSILTAANEAAVYQFLNHAIGFDAIYAWVNRAIEHFQHEKVDDIASIIDLDTRVKQWVTAGGQ